MSLISIGNAYITAIQNRALSGRIFERRVLSYEATHSTPEEEIDRERRRQIAEELYGGPRIYRRAKASHSVRK